MADDRSIREVRLEKLERMRALGCDPFMQERFVRSHTAQELLDRFDELAGELQTQFAGRVVSYRLMGKAGFAHVSDGDAKIQVYFRKDDLSETEWELYTLLDIGDHVGVAGELFRTKTGEKSIHARSLLVLSKCLEALPVGKVREIKDEAGNVTGTQSWYELEDTEQRYRHRHLDLIANPEARSMLINRAKITTAVRRYFDSQGFLEVETPMLQVKAGGAHARPFVTHYNHYEMDVKLRISLELYLKRIICGDVPKVYEIGRVFRNEGVSSRHNPEFTLCEFYEAYANLEDTMTRMEECFRFVANEVFGSPVVLPVGKKAELYNFRDQAPEEVVPFGRMRFERYELGEVEWQTSDRDEFHADDLVSAVSHCTDKNATFVSGSADLSIAVKEGFATDWIRVHQRSTFSCGPRSVELEPGCYQLCDDVTLDFSKPWKRVDLLTEIERLTDLTQSDLSDLSVALDRAAKLDIPAKARAAGGFIDLNKENNLGGFIEKLLEVFVEPTLQEPTFVVGYPIETSPLAKKDPKRPGFTRRFEGYVLGREICNAFSEINDPIDQRARLADQQEQLRKGNAEAQDMDEEFLYALECGMPPTGGCGFGIDRMAMLLTGADHVREVLMFPMMKPVREDD